jgi:hypothetical protein
MREERDMRQIHLDIGRTSSPFALEVQAFLIVVDPYDAMASLVGVEVL